MTSKAKVALFSMLAVAMMTSLIVPMMDVAEAHEPRGNKSHKIYHVPGQYHSFTDVDVSKVGSKSSYRDISGVNEKGEGELFAKYASKRSNGQVNLEFQKQVTIKDGDVVDVTFTGKFDRVIIRGQNDAKDSHGSAFPTVHAKNGNPGEVIAGCDTPKKSEYTKTTYNKRFTTTLHCHNLSAGTYEFNGYIHARTNTDNSGAQTTVYVSDGKLKVDVTTPK